MKLLTSKATVFAVLLSILALAAIVYVQHHRLPAKVETAVRAVVSTSCGLVPVLIVLSWRAWTKVIRPTLPVWRNGLALSSVVLLAFNWVFAVVLLALRSGGPTRVMFFNAGWMATLLYTSFVAALLAIALRGAARNYLIAAALLMFAYWQSGIYF